MSQNIRFAASLKALWLGLFAASAPVQVPAATTEVIAEGLSNPRGVAIAPDGSIWVTEAGPGGPGPCVPGFDGAPQCYGATGAVTRIRNGTVTRILSGLPSVADPGTGDNATGANRIAFQGNRAFVLMGHYGDPERRAVFDAVDPRLGKLLQVTPSGKAKVVADVTAFEDAANPEPRTLESNPFAILSEGHRRIVTDAAGNDILTVSAKGSVSLLAVIPSRTAPLPWDPDTEVPLESVPTALARGPDGALYIGELTGFPYPPGAARIFRLDCDGVLHVHAQGFTNIIDLAFGPDGLLYVLEIARNGLASGDPAGALLRLESDGSRTEIAVAGLVLPSALAIAEDGDIFVAVAGASGTQGKVLRVRP